MIRNRPNVASIVSVIFILLFLSNGNIALAAAENENLDSFYAEKFVNLNLALGAHIQQIGRCLAEIDTFEKDDKELFFATAECSKFSKMRSDAQDLINEAKTVSEEYLRWVESLTDNNFQKLVKRSRSSQAMLLASIGIYVTKHKKALIRFERVMEKQQQRLREFERLVQETRQQIESDAENEGAAVRTR